MTKERIVERFGRTVRLRENHTLADFKCPIHSYLIRAQTRIDNRLRRTCAVMEDGEECGLFVGPVRHIVVLYPKPRI